ncbi:MAG TPA: hypothetical protein VGC94_10635 [Amnibacterium sp.]
MLGWLRRGRRQERGDRAFVIDDPEGGGRTIVMVPAAEAEAFAAMLKERGAIEGTTLDREPHA